MTRTLATVLLVAVSLFGVSSCSSHKKASPPPRPVDERGTRQVSIIAAGSQFTPPDVIVSPGTTVTWRNQDVQAHNVKKAADALDFGGDFGVDAPQFGPGASYSFTFRKVGTFPYTCTIHTLMNGTVRVEAGVPSTAPSTAP